MSIPKFSFQELHGIKFCVAQWFQEKIFQNCRACPAIVSFFFQVVWEHTFCSIIRCNKVSPRNYQFNGSSFLFFSEEVVWDQILQSVTKCPRILLTQNKDLAQKIFAKKMFLEDRFSAGAPITKPIQGRRLIFMQMV